MNVNLEILLDKITETGWDAEIGDDAILTEVGDTDISLKARLTHEKVNNLAHNIKEMHPDISEDELYSKIAQTYIDNFDNTKKDASLIDKNVIEELKDWDKVQKRLFLALRNSNTEERYIYKNFLDMKICYHVEFNDSMITKITQDMADYWGKTIDDIHSVAFENTKNKYKVKLKRMTDMLLELMFKVHGKDIGEDALKEIVNNDHDNPMKGAYILTNDEGKLGATTMLYAFDELNTVLKDTDDPEQGLVIIPSSEHEVIVIPENDIKCMGDIRENLSRMITEINETELEERDRLSNIPYLYMPKLKTFTIY